MTDTPTDWTNWIITTAMAGLTTMIGTVVFLTKLIESKYVQEVRTANEEIATLSCKLDAQVAKHEDCMQLHHEAELRLARLEGQIQNKAEK
jgi:hypothetical protein